VATHTAHLSTVVNAFGDELDQIQSVFASCNSDSVVATPQYTYRPTEDGCLISLWDAWNRFVRQLLLACSAGTVHGLSGATYAPATVRDEGASLHHIRISKKGTHIKITAGEPHWFDARVIADLTSILGLGNATVIVGAVAAYQVQLGAFPVANPLEEIRLCRNFVAHKGSATLNSVTSLIGGRTFDLCKHVRSKRYGIETFSEWKEACRAIAEGAAQ
jgi:hypothetical protein